MVPGRVGCACLGCRCWGLSPQVWESVKRNWQSSVVVLAILAWGPSSATGQESAARQPSALQTAVAMQEVLVEAIAGAEASVVALARVRQSRPDETLNTEFRPDPFGRRTAPAIAPQPTDPDFMPNQFATGVVIDRRGLILTVYHALGEDSQYYVTTHERKVYRARVVAADPRSDLAVLSIEANGLKPIRLGDASAVRKGQMVVALGNPYAIARDGQVSAAWGIVANLGRKAPAMPDEFDRSGRGTLHHFGTLIQTDAKLNMGTSGGALLDLEGEMIGLITSLPAAAGFERAAGYAIPVDETFRRVVSTLKEGREVEYGFLGVQPSNLTAQERLEGRQGMRVQRVVPGTPADQHGLEADDVITAVNGKPIYDDDGLVLEVGRMPVESVARLDVLRGNRRLDMKVTLTKYPVRGKKIFTVRPDPWRGMWVDYSTALHGSGLQGFGELSRGAAFFDRGVVVTDVAEGSAAWEAGCRPGMLITDVEGQPVERPKQFYGAVRPLRRAVRLEVDGQDAPVTVPPMAETSE